MATATDIIASCDKWFNITKHDCTAYLKVVLTDFYVSGQFDDCAQADDILDKLNNTPNGWTDLNNDINAAVATAKAGNFVIAGMTSTELGNQNGHVAIVAGVDAQPSDNTPVPLGFARSIDSDGDPLDEEGRFEAKLEKLSKTFNKVLVQTGRVHYFSKTAEKSPNSWAGLSKTQKPD